jgi:hypothetical protein
MAQVNVFTRETSTLCSTVCTNLRLKILSKWSSILSLILVTSKNQVLKGWLSKQVETLLFQVLNFLTNS